ncbi:MAG: cofactor-independent phosphoglycerate mutase [bacterium]|nr:cofactor-independent phosphoglycerate mutase [bacterium]
MNKDRKFIILVGDGMADFPIESLGNITPLEAAKTPNMDYLAQNGVVGLARTVPAGMPPGSDTANLSIFGYNPKECYTGRAPLEALNIGIELGPKDVAFRCNLVNLAESTMEDFSGGHIENEYAALIIEEIANNISIPGIEFYPGVSYRNIVVWRDYPYKNIPGTIPPHDITGKETGPYVPQGEGAGRLNELMNMAREIITKSERIQKAAARYKGTATAIWLWGGGTKPSVETLNSRFGLEGYTISAVDLIHGIGKAAGLSSLHVDGATGYIDTNYEGKTRALLDNINTVNYTLLHVEAPDESGHQGNLEHKLKAIEDFDQKIVGPVLEGMNDFDDYTILFLPDHPTPISLKTHTPDPIPFCIYNKNGRAVKNLEAKQVSGYSEKEAESSGLVLEDGYRLIELMING